MEEILDTVLSEYEERKEEKAKEIPVDEKNQEFFQGTVNNNNKDSEYISNIIDKNNPNKLLGKKFLDKNKKGKYIELFHNIQMNAFGISSNITFIHSYSDDTKIPYDPFKFIAFRYYENGPQQGGKFFTLIKVNSYKFFILEKNDSVKDINNKLFYEEELNCYEIIRKIIFDKHKNGIIGDKGDTFPEIIGYCYALAYLDTKKNIKFMEPLAYDLNVKNCIIDNIPEIIVDNFIYIEPFIYDGHISLIISFRAKDGFRYNIILDMSSCHFEHEQPNLEFLPKTLKKRNIIFPKYPIQAYSSCCLWFYGEIECLLRSNDYSTYEQIFNSLKRQSIDFYINVINILSKEFEGNECIIRKEKEAFTDKNAHDIDLNRLLISHGKNYYSVHKDIIFSKFLNIDNFFQNLARFVLISDYGFLLKSQKLIMNIYELKNQILFNTKYYDLLPKNKDIQEAKLLLFDTLGDIDKLISSFKKDYDNVFYLKNIYCLERNIENVANKINKPFTLNKDRKEQILNCGGFDNFFDNISADYSHIKKDIEKTLRLFSENSISSQIKSINDICFVVMNK